jgi:membrane fusion protein, multidrug efflux system
MKNEKSLSMTALVIFTITLTFIGCSENDQVSTIQNNDENRVVPANVRVSAIELTTFTETLRLLGITGADADLTYSAEVAGRLEYLAVDYGDTVRRGQVLARVDYDMLTAQAEQAQAAYDLAQKTFERLEALRKDELVTQQQLDEARTARVQAEAQLRQTRTRLRQSEIQSTIDGVVSGRFARVGEYITPGFPLLRVIDYSEIIITAQVPETRIADIRPGLDVSVFINALNETFPGKVDVVLPNADPESRTFTIRVRTPNESGRILVGMATRLTINIKEHINVIVIPQDVIVELTEGRFVFVADDSVVKRKSVEPGPSERHSVVIMSGLNPGDLLITEGHRDLVDGQPVQVMNR